MCREVRRVAKLGKRRRRQVATELGVDHIDPLNSQPVQLTAVFTSRRLCSSSRYHVVTYRKPSAPCMCEPLLYQGSQPRDVNVSSFLMAHQHTTLCSMGNQLPLQKLGTTASTFRPMCLLWPNGWMDQDAIWYGSRPWPRPHCVRQGPSSP